MSDIIIINLISMQVFDANRDEQDTTEIIFPRLQSTFRGVQQPPLSTQYLRIIPTDCHEKCALRFEVIGYAPTGECLPGQFSPQGDIKYLGLRVTRVLNLCLVFTYSIYRFQCTTYHTCISNERKLIYRQIYNLLFIRIRLVC